MKKPLLILFTIQGIVLAILVISYCLVPITGEGTDALTWIDVSVLAAMGLFLWWWCRRVIKMYPLSTDKKSKK